MTMCVALQRKLGDEYKCVQQDAQLLEDGETMFQILVTKGEQKKYLSYVLEDPAHILDGEIRDLWVGDATNEVLKAFAT